MSNDKNHKLTKFHKAHGRHWHYLYARRRKRVLGINATEMATSQILSLIGSVVAGVHLEASKGTMALVVGTFVILPAVFDLDGSIGATLSAKINHRLEDAKASTLRVYFGSVAFAVLIAALAGMIVAFVGSGVATIFFDAEYWRIFKISLGAVILSGIIGFPIIGLLSLFFRKLKVNPDDVVGPIESSVFDVLTVTTIVWVIGWLTV